MLIGLAALAGRATADSPTTTETSPIATIADRLRTDFDRRIEDPATYREQALKQCQPFPEGGLFPFVFPALGYAHLGMQDPAMADHARVRMEKLLRIAAPLVAARVKAPQGNLTRLKSYAGHAVHLGQFNLALSYYRRLGGDDNALLGMNDALSSLLLKALEQSRGRPIESYPGQTWPFDTMPCVVSLNYWDKERERVAAIVQLHLNWLRNDGSHPRHRLPYSREPGSLPRGCDLSLRIALLKELDAAYAKETYARYHKLFWRQQGLFSGFAEYPEGQAGPEDMDSGPIIHGIGLAATGNGFAAAAAMGDQETLAVLTSQLRLMELVAIARGGNADLKRLIDGGYQQMGLAFDPQYVTGFLFGDAVLFGVITWPQPD